MKLSFKWIYLIFSILNLLSASVTNAQTAKWDSTYRPSKYIEQIAKFKADAITKNDYVNILENLCKEKDFLNKNFF